jgi:SAM-dependent methyltransferase
MNSITGLCNSESAAASLADSSLECERCDPHVSPPHLVKLHTERYHWAKPFVRGKRVLDVACGVGYGSRILYDGGAAAVHGVDNDQAAVNIARERYSASKIYFSQDDAEALDSLSELAPFDRVVSFETIEHLEYPEKFLSAVIRVLSPSGGLHISTPCRSTGSLEARPSNPFHRREFSFDEFGALLTRYFRKIDWYGQGLPYLNRGPRFYELISESCLRGLLFLCGRRRVSSDADIFSIRERVHLRGEPAVIIAYCIDPIRTVI